MNSLSNVCAMPESPVFLRRSNMKNFILIFTFLFASLQVMANDTLVVLSPVMGNQQAKQSYKSIRGVYFNLSPNSSLTVINGMTGKTLMYIKLPDKDAYNDPKAKYNFEPFRWIELKKFFKAMPLSSNGIQATSGQLDIPRLMNQVERYQGISELIIIGSPLYDIATNPKMSMKSELVPSDGYLLNTARNNVFRTQGFEARLTNIRMHWLLFDALPRQVHNDAVQRFWHHYLARQGASLVSFNNDVELMLRLYKTKAPAMALPDRLATKSKLEMQAIEDISVSINLYDSPISKAILPLETVVGKQVVTVGISWQSPKVDFDIHAKPLQGERLYFEHQTSTQGQFYKGKIQHTKDTTRHETIVFHVPINTKRLLLALNLYSIDGDLKLPITGEIRIKLQEQVYAHPFYFQVNNGNLGADTETAIKTGQATAYTKLFRIKDIIAQSVDEVSR